MIEVVQKMFVGVTKDCIKVKVTDEDYKLCEERSLGDNFWANSKPGAYSKGLGATLGDEYRPARVGLLGQMAFSKVVGIPPDMEYRKGGDLCDLVRNGLTYDIKCSMRNYNHGLVYHTNEWGRQQELTKDIYVFSYLESEYRGKYLATIIFVGYAFPDDIRKCSVEEGKRGNGHLNWVVPYAELKSITEICSVS